MREERRLPTGSTARTVPDQSPAEHPASGRRGFAALAVVASALSVGWACSQDHAVPSSPWGIDLHAGQTSVPRDVQPVLSLLGKGLPRRLANLDEAITFDDLTTGTSAWSTRPAVCPDGPPLAMPMRARRVLGGLFLALWSAAPVGAFAQDDAPAPTPWATPPQPPVVAPPLESLPVPPIESRHAPEVRRVRPGVFEVRGELIDYRALRAQLRVHPDSVAARFDRRARGLEIATWSLVGLSGAGFVIAGALLPATEGGTLVYGFPVAGVPAIAALATGMDALRLRRMAVETFVQDDLGSTAHTAPLLAPEVRVGPHGASIGVCGVF